MATPTSKIDKPTTSRQAIPTKKSRSSSAKTGWLILGGLLAFILAVPLMTYALYPPARNFTRFGLWLFEVQTPPRLSSKTTSLPDYLLSLQVRSPSQEFIKTVGKDLQSVNESAIRRVEFESSNQELERRLKLKTLKDFDNSEAGETDPAEIEKMRAAKAEQSKARIGLMQELSQFLINDTRLVQFEASVGIFANENLWQQMKEAPGKQARLNLMRREVKAAIIVQAAALKEFNQSIFDEGKRAKLISSLENWKDLKPDLPGKSTTPPDGTQQGPKNPAPSSAQPQIAWIDGYPAIEIKEDLTEGSSTEANTSLSIFMTYVGPDQIVMTTNRDLMREVLNLAYHPPENASPTPSNQGILSVELNTGKLLKALPMTAGAPVPEEVKQLSSLRGGLNVAENLSLEILLGFESENGQIVVDRLHQQAQGFLQMTQMLGATDESDPDSGTIDFSQSANPGTFMQSLTKLLTKKDALRIEARKKALAIRFQTPFRPYIQQAVDYAKFSAQNAREDQDSLKAVATLLKLPSETTDPQTTPPQFETLELQRVANPQDQDAHYYGSVGGLPKAYQVFGVVIKPNCRRNAIVQAQAMYPEQSPSNLAAIKNSLSGLRQVSSVMEEPLIVTLKPLMAQFSPPPGSTTDNSAPVSFTRSARQASWFPLIETNTSSSASLDQSQSTNLLPPRNGDFVLRLSYLDAQADQRQPAQALSPQNIFGAMQALGEQTPPCEFRDGGPRILYRPIGQ